MSRIRFILTLALLSFLCACGGGGGGGGNGAGNAGGGGGGGGGVSSGGGGGGNQAQAQDRFTSAVKGFISSSPEDAEPADISAQEVSELDTADPVALA